ncbi:MAG TPA: hypothetical protein VFK06_14570 [Candidatus Angelobacter sp.]|nr:hypothetical protein [Candidatus Angelobacter sp.]
MATKIKNTICRRNENGSALLVALFALLLLTAIGIGFMFMADTESSVNNNYRDSQKAYFAARAGLENVRVLLAPGGTLNAQALGLKMPSASSNTGIFYVLNPTGTEAVDPSDTNSAYLDDELCQEQYGTGTGGSFATAFTTPAAGIHCGPNITNSTPTTSAFKTGTPGVSDIPNIATSSALPFKWVRITNKQNFMGLLAAGGTSTSFTVDGSSNYGWTVCYDGTNEVAVDPNAIPGPGNVCEKQPTRLEPVWLLTALAVTPKVGANPGSKRIVQMELASPPPVIVTPQGTVSTEAPITFQGSSTSVNAMDYCTCNIPACTTDKNGITSCGVSPAAPSGTTSCDASHHSVFTANTVSTNGQPVAVSSFGSNLNGAASVQNVSPWPYNVGNLISQYQGQAVNASFNSSCSGTPNITSIPPVYSTCGTQTNQKFGTYPTTFPDKLPNGSANPSAGLLDPSTAVPQVTYVSGSVQLTAGANGAGVLVIDGDLDVHGGLNFYGLILVRGQVTFTGGGSDKTNLNGAILAGQDITNKGCPQGSTNCDTSDTIGGSVTLQYDSCALKNASLMTQTPPHLLATHEIQY